MFCAPLSQCGFHFLLKLTSFGPHCTLMDMSTVPLKLIFIWIHVFPFIYSPHLPFIHSPQLGRYWDIVQRLLYLVQKNSSGVLNVEGPPFLILAFVLVVITAVKPCSSASRFTDVSFPPEVLGTGCWEGRYAGGTSDLVKIVVLDQHHSPGTLNGFLPN